MKARLPKADTTLANSKELKDKLIKAGWDCTLTTTTTPRAGHNDKYVLVLTRTIPNPKTQNHPHTSTSQHTDTSVTKINSVTESKISPSDSLDLAKSVIKSSGNPKDNFDTKSFDMNISDKDNSMSSLKSIQDLRMEGDSIVLSLDTEFYYYEDKGFPESKVRSILSWQLAFIVPDDPEHIQEIIFCSTDGRCISLGFIIAYILEKYNFDCLCPDGFEAVDYRKAHQYVYHTVGSGGVVKYHFTGDIDEAIMRSKYTEEEIKILKQCKSQPHQARCNDVDYNGKSFINLSKPVDGYLRKPEVFNNIAAPITILCHSGKADLSTFDFSDGSYIMRNLSEIQKGLATLQSFYIYPSNVCKYNKFYPVNLTIRDTMCFAPEGKKSLASLGEAVHIPKIEVSDEYKSQMLNYLCEHPVHFADYAANDSVITLCYAGELWGYNRQMPLTITSAAAKAAVPRIALYLNIECDEGKKIRAEFNYKFRGLKNVSKGLCKSYGALGFTENNSLEPVSDNARILQTYAKNAYHGGYNGAMLIGKYDGVQTYDFDLHNAYPTAMSLVPDVNWIGKVISKEYVDKQITLEDVPSPFALVFGYITFSFPDDVQYPCIAVSVEGSLVFPRSSKGLDGVYSSAPEIYLALKLGAKITAKRLYVGVELKRSDNTTSYSLRATVKQFINDRTEAKRLFGKGSLAELLLKISVNGLYGKLSQDILQKMTYDAYNDTMVDIGESPITSPTHACLTTAIVRCVLLSALNQLADKGRKLFSVTTDGFITDASEEELNSLDLYGFADAFREARMSLTGSEEIWEIKHRQNDLLNFTTRGNVSLSLEGVCAHSGYVTGFVKDSYDDRVQLMTRVLSREGKLKSVTKTFTTFRRLANIKNPVDFCVEERSSDLSMDFDMKRKPIRDSFYTANTVIDDTTYEIANFNTEPYENVDEFILYKNTAKGCKVLRTSSDWKLFFAKISGKHSGNRRRIKDLNWSVLFTCVMGHRLGVWVIPFLDDPDMSLNDKLKCINYFNRSEKSFEVSDWKNAGRQNRASQMLERTVVEDLLMEMQRFH